MFQALNHSTKPYSSRVQASMYMKGSMPIVDAHSRAMLAMPAALRLCSSSSSVQVASSSCSRRRASCQADSAASRGAAALVWSCWQWTFLRQPSIERYWIGAEGCTGCVALQGEELSSGVRGHGPWREQTAESLAASQMPVARSWATAWQKLLLAVGFKGVLSAVMRVRDSRY